MNTDNITKVIELIRSAFALGLTGEQRQDLFFMSNVPHQSLLDLGATDPDANCEVYHKRVLSTFDTFPPELRRQAAINVLTILLEVGQVHWLPAIISAHASYHRGELSPDDSDIGAGLMARDPDMSDYEEKHTHEMSELQQGDGTH